MGQIEEKLVYAATCKLCSKFYTGKTTPRLCGRICEHKRCYNKYRKQVEIPAFLVFSDINVKFC